MLSQAAALSCFSKMVRPTFPILAINALLTAPFHDWLPGNSHVTEKYLCSVARDAGVSRIAFIRHGQTAPKPPNSHDFDRILTDEGRLQAKEAGSSYGKDLIPFFQKMLVSPAPRTMETAALFVEAVGTATSRSGERLATIEPIPMLYDGTMQPEGSKLFQKLGYAPLEEYLNCDDQADRDAARKVLGEYAHDVTGAIIQVLDDDSNKNKSGKDTTLCVVAHAIYLPAAALGVASVAGCSDQNSKIMLKTNTKEEEGYLIDLDTKKCSNLTRPTKVI